MGLDPDVGVVLVDHGSRRAEANAMLETVARLYGETMGVAIVEPAHMELAPPAIAEAFDRCVARGARRVVIALFFLSPGRHSRTDIPALVAEAAARHPGVAWHLAEPLGIDARIAAVLHDRVRAALPERPSGDA